MYITSYFWRKEENFWEPSYVLLGTQPGILYTFNLICLHYLSELSYFI